jgi:uncharacterized protein with von Willebrand factor type A (vWA) domain
MKRNRNSNDDFLKDFFAGKARKGSDRSVNSKYTIVHDKWDGDDYTRIHAEVKDFGVAEKALKQVAGDPATAAMADEFFSLVKAVPVLKDPKTIRPSHMVNAAVMAEQMKLAEYESLRSTAVGDPIGTALAAIAMEPQLEILYDKLKEEQKLADEMEQKMQEHEGLQEEQESVEEMMEKAQQEGDEQKAQNYQEQAELIQAAMDKLQEEIEGAGEQLDEQLDGKAQQIRQGLNKALAEANKDADQQSALSTAWGLDRGTLQRMDAKKRIELSKKMKNEKFQRLADLIGPMMRMAWAAQNRKVNYTPEEIYDVGIGNDLPHMLPSEYLYLNHPVLKMDWMRRYTNHALLQYELRGSDKVAKGGIIFCEDGSGSMSGSNEVWAKAVGLALLHVAKMQKRPFTGIHFGGPGEIKTFEFTTTDKEFKSHTEYGHTHEELTGVESVIDFAEIFFGGGTDFVTPLSRALDQLRKEHEKYGAVKGDIVFVTDGACGVPDKWLEEFKAEQARLGFRVFGIVIGGHSSSEPLNTIADGKVVEIKDLMSGGDIGHIFEAI